MMNERTVRDRLTEATHFWYDLANEVLKLNLPYPEIRFNLRGCVAGKAWSYQNRLDFHVTLAIQNFEDFIEQTVPHEVAHIVADRYYGKRCIHGREWKWVMEKVFNRPPVRCHSYDCSSIIAKRKNTSFQYRCACERGVIVGKKHNRLIHEGMRVWCKTCKTVLTKDMFVDMIQEIDIERE